MISLLSGGSLLQDSAWRPSKKKRLGIYYIAHSGCYTVRWPFCIEEEEEKSGRLSRSIKKRRWCSPDSQWLSTSASISTIRPSFNWLLLLLLYYYGYYGGGIYSLLLLIHTQTPFHQTCSIMYSAKLFTMCVCWTQQKTILHMEEEKILVKSSQKKKYKKKRETV